MGKLGSYAYPERKIDDVLEAIRSIRDKLKGNMASIDTIAVALGYKGANNGAFQHKLNDLRKYGLIEGRGKDMGLSDLAKRILVQKDLKDIREMVFHMPLWKGLYDKFGANPTDFSTALKSVTGADILEIDAVKDTVSKLYIDAVSKIGNINSNEKADDLDFQSNDQTGQFDNKKDVLTFSAEGITLKITNDQEHLEKAGAFINLFLAQPRNSKGELKYATKTQKKTESEDKLDI